MLARLLAKHTILSLRISTVELTVGFARLQNQPFEDLLAGSNGIASSAKACIALLETRIILGED
jgi:hypothetical protein